VSINQANDVAVRDPASRVTSPTRAARAAALLVIMLVAVVFGLRRQRGRG
jgi:hypothetical protein